MEPGAINGGMFQRADRLTTPILTVDVEDIDRSLERILETGGSVVSPRAPVPGMGWFAYFEDSEGNILGLWTTDANAS